MMAAVDDQIHGCWARWEVGAISPPPARQMMKSGRVPSRAIARVASTLRARLDRPASDRIGRSAAGLERAQR